MTELNYVGNVTVMLCTQRTLPDLFVHLGYNSDDNIHMLYGEEDFWNIFAVSLEFLGNSLTQTNQTKQTKQKFIKLYYVDHNTFVELLFCL